MIDIPRIAPVSELRYKHREMFDSLKQGPIVLAQRSREAAVLVSVEEWRRIAQRMKQLEQERRNLLANRQFEAVSAGEYVDYATVTDELEALDHANPIKS